MRTPEGALPGEVGGYFGLESHRGSLFHDDAIALNTGRNGLVYLIESRGIERIWLPDYLCRSVPLAVSATGIEMRTFPVDKHLKPQLPPDLPAHDWLYVVNYFGQFTHEFDALRHQHPRLIVDHAQAFFTPPIDGIDTIYTCRKYFGVADGGFLSTDSTLDRELPRGTSADSMAHVLGRVETRASDHYPVYRDSERRLASLPTQRMSIITESLLRSVNYADVASIREQNFAALAEALDDINELEVVMPPGPFAYPFLHPLGARLRPLLHARKIYVPMLWPDVLSSHGAGEHSKYLANSLIPIPVDQRYSPAVMAHLVDTLKELLDDLH